MDAARRKSSLDALESLKVKQVQIQFTPQDAKQAGYAEVPYGYLCCPCCASPSSCLWGCECKVGDPRCSMPMLLAVGEDSSSGSSEPQHHLGHGVNLARFVLCCGFPSNAVMVRAPPDVRDMLSRQEKGTLEGLSLQAIRKKVEANSRNSKFGDHLKL